MVKVKTISIKQLSTSSLHTNLFRRQRNMTGFVRSARPIAVRETREVERERERERDGARETEAQRETEEDRENTRWLFLECVLHGRLGFEITTEKQIRAPTDFLDSEKRAH